MRVTTLAKAAILEQLNNPLIVDDVELPEKLDVGQVMVQVLCATICGAQIGEIMGNKGEDKYLPHLLGHEGCGRVVDIGAGVTKVKVGDHVVMHWRKGKGIEAPFPKYLWKGRTVGGGSVTTFNQFSIVSENRLTPVSADVDPEVASLMGCALTTAFGIINNEAKLKIGQSIAVAGCGGVGLNVIQGATMVSADAVIGIDVMPNKLANARLFGATNIINSSEAKIVESVKAIVKNGVDVFVDCTGNPLMIDEGFAATAPGGRMVLVGQPSSTTPLVFKNARQHYCGKRLLDSQGGLTDPDVDIPRYISLYEHGKLRLEGLITHRFPLKDINMAIKLMHIDRTCGRVALEMT